MTAFSAFLGAAAANRPQEEGFLGSLNVLGAWANDAGNAKYALVLCDAMAAEDADCAMAIGSKPLQWTEMSNFVPPAVQNSPWMPIAHVPAAGGVPAHVLVLGANR